ncbi:MAG: DUF1579 domain-containing protein [Phycisphaerales bacterium]|nr:MAG: DUF1579 domain-containing protein [Phycisphaerales bacterium]
MAAKSQRQHTWLQQLVGEWTYDSECIMEPGQSPTKAKGIEHVRAFGELWIIMEGTLAMADGTEMSVNITLGYDPQRDHFVGACACSPMTHLWVYEGSDWDEKRDTLTMFVQGPSMNPDAGGAMVKYKDVIELKGRDERIMTSHVLGDDGQWRCFSTLTYRRKS